VSPPEDASTVSFDPILAAYDKAVELYRTASDRDSVHRCAFGVSCSHFADRALHRYGVEAGLIVFVDRYFYRENQMTRYYYPLVELPDGTFRSDDSFFVP